MRVGKKKYKLSYCIKKWFKSQFYRYDAINNRQCAFGIRSNAYKGNKCLNRFHIIKCGECWRASNLHTPYGLNTPCERKSRKEKEESE